MGLIDCWNRNRHSCGKKNSHQIVRYVPHATRCEEAGLRWWPALEVPIYAANWGGVVFATPFQSFPVAVGARLPTTVEATNTGKSIYQMPNERSEQWSLFNQGSSVSRLRSLAHGIEQGGCKREEFMEFEYGCVKRKPNLVKKR